MKKMFFGTLLIFVGLSGFLSLLHNYIANTTYANFNYFLRNEGFGNLLYIFVLVLIIGFLICLNEAYNDFFINSLKRVVRKIKLELEELNNTSKD